MTGASKIRYLLAGVVCLLAFANNRLAANDLGVSASDFAAQCKVALDEYALGRTPRTLDPLQRHSALYLFRQVDGQCGWATANNRVSAQDAKEFGISRCSGVARGQACQLVALDGKLIPASVEQFHAANVVNQGVEPVNDAGGTSSLTASVATGPKRDFAGVRLGMTLEQTQDHIKKEKCTVTPDLASQTFPNLPKPSFLRFACPAGFYAIGFAEALPNRPIYFISFTFCTIQTGDEVSAMLKLRYSIAPNRPHDGSNGYQLEDGVYFLFLESSGGEKCPETAEPWVAILKDPKLVDLNQQAIDNARRSVPAPRF
jgi:hypothetical protein